MKMTRDRLVNKGVNITLVSLMGLIFSALLEQQNLPNAGVKLHFACMHLAGLASMHSM